MGYSLPANDAHTDMLWQVPSWLKPILSLDHPRVYFSRAELDVAKSNLGNVGPAWAGRCLADILNRLAASIPAQLSHDEIRRFMPKPGAYYTNGILESAGPDGSKLELIGWEQPGKVRTANGMMLPDANHPDDGNGWQDETGKMHYFVARWNGFYIEQLTQIVEPLAMAYALTQDSAYAAKAATILDALATVYPLAIEGALDYPGAKPGIEGGRLDRPYYQVGRRLVLYAAAADLIWDSEAFNTQSTANPQLTVKDNVVYNLLLNGADYCYRQTTASPKWLTNGIADYNRGVLAVGSLLGIDQYLEWAIDGPNSILTMLANNIDREGNYFETSSGYSQYTGFIFSDMAEMLFHVRSSKYPQGLNLYDVPRFAGFYIGNRERQLICGRIPAYGDTGSDMSVGGKSKFDQRTFNAAWRFYARTSDTSKRTDYWRYLCAMTDGHVEENIREIWAVFNTKNLPGEWETADSSALPPRVSEIHAGKGMAFLRAGEGHEQRGVFMRYGATWYHGHKDELALMLFAADRELSFDPGYWSAHYRCGWQYQTVAHITATIDEQSQANLPSAGGSLNFFMTTPGLSVVDASDASCYRSVAADTYRRLVALVDVSSEHSYIVDIFRVTGGQLRDYSFHAIGRDFAVTGLDLSDPKPGSLADPNYAWGSCIMADGMIAGHTDKPWTWSPDPGTGYGFLSSPSSAATNNAWSASWSAPGLVSLTMLAQPNREVIVADGPDIMGVKYVLARDKGDAPSQFVSVIQMGKEDAPKYHVDNLLTKSSTDSPAMEPIAFSIDLTTDVSITGVTDYILSSTDGSLFSASNADVAFTSDAQFAAVRMVGKDIAAVRMVKGTRLVVNDLEISVRLPELQGRIIAVDYEQGSILVDGDPALLSGTVGREILINATEYSHNSPYTAQSVAPEGPYYRINLTPADLMLGKGQVGSFSDNHDGQTLPNNIYLPLARHMFAPGTNDYYKGKLVVNDAGASTTIASVLNDSSLTVNNISGFQTGDNLTIYDVKAGDNYTIPVSVSLIHTPEGAWQCSGVIDAEVIVSR